MARPVDLKGKLFGLWTVLGRAENNPNGKTQWKCRCECGTIKNVTTNSLKSYNSTSCGCNNTLDLSNMRFGKLLVLEDDHTHGRRAWNCLCGCGQHTIVSSGDLRTKRVSCCEKCRIDTAVLAAPKDGTTSTLLKTLVDVAVEQQRCFDAMLRKLVEHINVVNDTNDCAAE